ncbi:hypothetical protein P4561_16415 [Priestia flexa]|nr:hypothetical protein [Priestia flexa]MED3825269.1 hypothetical protein [Priestia flexa]
MSSDLLGLLFLFALIYFWLLGAIRPMDVTLPLGIGSSYLMDSANWMILYGSNVVKLSGNKAVMIGYGTAQVQAFKSNGSVLGVYTFVVNR